MAFAKIGCVSENLPGSEQPSPVEPTPPQPGDVTLPQSHEAVGPQASEDTLRLPSELAVGGPSSPPPPWIGPPPQPASGVESTPKWLLPAVAAIALVIGLLSGAVGGVVASRNVAQPGGSSVPGLDLPRRTVAPLPADNSSIPSVAEKVLPSTVQIVAEYQGEAAGATGSGWVFDENGHIVTNNHVIENAAKDKGPIKIIDYSGKHYSAEVVGRSAVYDLAVLKVSKAKQLTPLVVGASQEMRVGETVVAVGSPLGLSSSVTSGIISALDRPVSTGNGGDSNSYINAVQTDAAINPGNSGGPLVNLHGQVIGVNSAIATMTGGISGDQSGNIGVGFAIPAEQVLTTVTQIIKTGQAQYPVIGAGVRGTESMDGATITNVEPGMPAAQAGLKVDDVVRQVNGRPIAGSIDLVVAIRSQVAGEQVTLLIERGGKTQEIKVRLAAKVG